MTELHEDLCNLAWHRTWPLAYLQHWRYLTLFDAVELHNYLKRKRDDLVILETSQRCSEHLHLVFAFIILQ